MNFETVKYFNAEKHEDDRFNKAVAIYAEKSIGVALSMFALNATQALMIAVGLASMLSLAYHFTLTGLFDVGTFIMF